MGISLFGWELHFGRDCTHIEYCSPEPTMTSVPVNTPILPTLHMVQTFRTPIMLRPKGPILNINVVPSLQYCHESPGFYFFARRVHMDTDVS
jgi:hypothetical protein